jgi:hypothetical protein
MVAIITQAQSSLNFLLKVKYSHILALNVSLFYIVLELIVFLREYGCFPCQHYRTLHLFLLTSIIVEVKNALSYTSTPPTPFHDMLYLGQNQLYRDGFEVVTAVSMKSTIF